MAEAGYTTIYNAVMRDIDLTLPAKGLYAVIKSLIGLPGLVLKRDECAVTVRAVVLRGIHVVHRLARLLHQVIGMTEGTIFRSREKVL